MSEEELLPKAYFRPGNWLVDPLNPHNIEAVIRKALLPRLFGLLGLDRAKEVIEQIVQVTRIGLSRAP